MDEDTLNKSCLNLDLKLKDESQDQRDIVGDELFHEIVAFKFITNDQKKSSPLAVLEYLMQHDLTSAFPNLFIALRILLTLPVSVASGERFFSRHKIIQNDL